MESQDRFIRLKEVVRITGLPSSWPKVRLEPSVGGLGRMMDDFNSGRSKLLGKGR
jgi:hypothetical protein